MVPVDVILYQTSSSGSPVAQPTGIPVLAVASQTVPALFIAPLVSVTAPLQLSFAGGVGVEAVMVNAEPEATPPIDPVPNEYTLI